MGDMSQDRTLLGFDYFVLVQCNRRILLLRISVSSFFQVLDLFGVESCWDLGELLADIFPDLVLRSVLVFHWCIRHFGCLFFHWLHRLEWGAAAAARVVRDNGICLDEVRSALDFLLKGGLELSVEIAHLFLWFFLNLRLVCVWHLSCLVVVMCVTKILQILIRRLLNNDKVNLSETQLLLLSYLRLIK